MSTGASAAVATATSWSPSAIVQRPSWKRASSRGSAVSVTRRDSPGSSSTRSNAEQPRARRGQVELGDVGAGALARVGHGEGRGDGLAAARAPGRRRRSSCSSSRGRTRTAASPAAGRTSGSRPRRPRRSRSSPPCPTACRGRGGRAAGSARGRRGSVIGSRPDGLTAPVSTSAIACPPAWPGYQAATIARTSSRHGIATGLPVSSTTTVFGLAAATASITASWPHGSDRSGLS